MKQKPGWDMSDNVVVEVGSSIDEYLERTRLAGQRQREPGLLARRPDPADGGQGHRQLLAEPRLPAGRGRGPPRGRPPHPRPRHARPATARAGRCASFLAEGLNGVPGQGRRRARRGTSASAVGQIVNFLGTHAERVGGRAGVQLVRHVHGAVRPARRPVVRGGPAGHPGARLQPQRAVPLGHADAVHQPHVRLDVPGRPARRGAVRRRRSRATSPTATCRPRWT